MKKIIILLLISTNFIFAQDVNYAKHMLAKLTSKAYHGRGYVKNGDLVAAKFIAKQFENDGLSNFNNSYFQKYSFPINTIQGKLSVKIDGNELIAGSDYVVSLSAPSVNKTFKIYNLSNYSTNIDSILKAVDSIGDVNGIYLINEKNARKVYGKSISNISAMAVLTSKIPYWHVSNGSSVENTVWLKIKSDAIPKNASTIKIISNNKFVENHNTQNIIGFVPGSSHPEKYIVFSAHYDHLGMMGNKVYYPGANDNASGTSMVLDLARYYSLPENKPEYSIVFMIFSGEEVGLLGSSYYADNPLFPLDNIKYLINLDMVGSGSDGITVVNGKVYDTLFNTMVNINDKNHFLKEVKSRGESCNSDHCPFYKKGVKSVFIYTRGKELTAYHTPTDNSKDFPFTAYNGLFNLLTDVVKKLR